MNTFDERIKSLETEVHALKTEGLGSSSALGVAEHTATITQEIIGYTVNFPNDNCASRDAAIIEIIPADGKNMLTSISMRSNQNNLVGREQSIKPTILNGHNAYEFRFISGSATDLATIQGGTAIPPFNLDFLITGTSEFSTNITYRQYH